MIRQFVCIILVLLAAGCGDWATTPPVEEPALTGTVTVIGPLRSPLRSVPDGVRVLVESRDPQQRAGGSDAVIFSVSNRFSRVLVRGSDGRWTRGAHDALADGQLVTVWYAEDMIILDSSPPQATAGAIAIH